MGSSAGREMAGECSRVPGGLGLPLALVSRVTSPAAHTHVARRDNPRASLASLARVSATAATPRSRSSLLPSPTAPNDADKHVVCLTSTTAKTYLSRAGG